MMKVDNHREHYRLDAELYDYFAELHPVDMDSARRVQQAVLHYAEFRDGAMVLDIGSGNGWLMQALEPRGCTVVSVDLGLQNLRRLKAMSGGRALAASADAAVLPFRDGTFDFVVASEILEHLNDPERTVREALRVLKPGGVFAVSTPYKEKLRTYLCVHCNKPTPANAHIQTFDEERHREQAAKAGFAGIRYELIQNKFFVFSRFSYFCRWAPFWLWRFIDGFCNLLFRRANTIVLRASKPLP